MKRTYEATFPDGTTVTRSTKSFNYRYVGAVLERDGHWYRLGWSQTREGAIKTAIRAYGKGGPLIDAFPCKLVSGTEI